MGPHHCTCARLALRSLTEAHAWARGLEGELCLHVAFCSRQPCLGVEGGSSERKHCPCTLLPAPEGRASQESGKGSLCADGCDSEGLCESERGILGSEGDRFLQACLLEPLRGRLLPGVSPPLSRLGAFDFGKGAGKKGWGLVPVQRWDRDPGPLP